MQTALRDATTLASAVRSGELSAEGVLAESQARADAASALRAFIQEDWDGAAIAAKEVDRRRARGEDPGPLAGVPLSVKDVIAVAGLRLTGGSTAYTGNVASFTATAVRRLQEAGAVVVGKTNCPEFAFGVVTESTVGGRMPSSSRHPSRRAACTIGAGPPHGARSADGRTSRRNRDCPGSARQPRSGVE